tara:strand:+ start:1755 stop:2498 length:744 start_codon:yes stop_codon:yes gene_type:complete
VVKVAKKAKSRDKQPTQKDIKQPDQFVETSTKGAEWLNENRNAVIVVCLTIFAVALGIYTFFYFNDSSKREATTALGEALKLYNAEVTEKKPTDDSQKTFKTSKEKFTASITAFEKVIKKYGKTRAALIAHLFTGNSYMQLSKCDKAIPHYKKFKAGLSPEDPMYYLGANGLAYCLESTGKAKEGLKILDSVQEKGPAYTKAFALMRLAEYYQHKGNNKQARKYYEKLAKDKSSFQAEAKKRLAVLP